MSCPGGSLTKTVYSTIFPHKTHTYILMCSLHTHIHTHTTRKSERAVMPSSDIYLSNPISHNPYLPSPPSAHAGATHACTSVKVKCTETGGGREREIDGWRGVADVCWTTHCLTETCSEPATDKPLLSRHTGSNSDNQLFCLSLWCRTFK